MANKVPYFDVKQELLKRIKKNGGWSNTHAHIDRAYTITKENFHLINATIAEKWHLNDEIKRSSRVNDVYDRMAQVVESMIEQGVTTLGTFIDVDEAIQDKAIKAAQKLRDTYKKDITIRYINQVHKGVLTKEAREWFDIGAQFVDIIGGLPSADKPHMEEHLDVLFSTAKKMKKMVHAHVDQGHNFKKEKETELLAKKTIEHGMQGKVVGVHGISIATHDESYREELYALMKKADLMMITCPIGMLESNPSEDLVPSRNAMLPVDELVPAGITVALGTDNIADIYVPLADGDMWAELSTLIYGVRFRDLDELVKIASVNGRKVLGVV
ncbi:MAG TPA: amidohydrolase family protein [Patescibacteria group bacterium]|nr:amidohydrolase family protein [Patescibacteria group bacterium]